MVQIGGYLEPIEHESLKVYVRRLGISQTSLASLLIHRELRRQRLQCLKAKFTKVVSNKTRRRVTAHLSEEELKLRFSNLAQDAGLRVDHAASILFRAELEERWLENAM